MLYAALLGPGAEAKAFATTESALTHLACWDRADAQRLRVLLLRRLGTGNDSALTVGSLLGNGDGALLSDYSKREVLVRYASKKLVERRRDALDAMARGFGAVLDAAQLGPALRGLAPHQLGALLFGGSYVDVEALKRVLVWDAAWPVNEAQVAWLSDALGRLTEPALRLLLARATGRLQLRPDGCDSPILVLRAPMGEGEEEAEVPRYPGGNILQLPADCPSYATFEQRLRASLGLHGEYTTVSRLGLGLGDGARRLVRLLAPPAAVTKVFECPNAHLFALGPPPGGVPAPPEAQGRCPECNALASAAGGPKAKAGTVLSMAVSPKYAQPGSPARGPAYGSGASSGYASPLGALARRTSEEH